ncbi:hypothetical protein U1Q18_019573 [Sarracenia purpurea var. burkii]
MEAEDSADWLPTGWTEHVDVKNNRKRKCYIDPLTGRRFYSKPQVSEYLKTVKHNSSPSQRKKTSNMDNLSGGRNSEKLEGSQYRTRSSGKQIQMGFSEESVERKLLLHNTGEITRSNTSPKQDEATNVKTPERTSRASKSKQRQSIEKVVIEKVTPDELPPGWIKEIKIQRKTNGTRRDPYYTDPVSGYVFFSQKDVQRYLETGDFSSCSIRPKKRNELGFLNEESFVTSTVDELTGGKASLKQEKSQNAETPKQRSGASKQKQLGSSKRPVKKPNTGELSGGKITPNQKESQSVKTPTLRSRVSKPKQMDLSIQPIEKDVIERVTPEGLPPGWIKEIKIQTYYTDPVSGYVFYSQKDALRYLETGDFSSCLTKPRKRDEIEFLNEETSFSPNTSELIGGKRKGSQKIKTPDPKSCTSKRKQKGSNKQSVDKVTSDELPPGGIKEIKIEKTTPDGLPPGWIKEIKIEKKATGIRRDPYYTDPVSGYVFFSQKDALRYLETGDFSSCSIRPKKRDVLGFLNEVASPNMGELTGSKQPLKLEGPQNVKTTKHRSRDSKEKQNGFTKQSEDKVVIERIIPTGLPPGWIQENKIRVNENGIRKDPFYTDPTSGYVFGSKKDALRYLETGDFSSCATKPKKRDKLQFLNEESSLPSAAILHELGHHTPRRQPSSGKRNHATSSSKKTNADGPRKRQRKSVPSDAIATTTTPIAEIEASAGAVESNDPSNSQLLRTKDTKRKRANKVRAENGSLEENGKEKKSKRKTQNKSSQSKSKKELEFPGRSSKRLSGLICEMVANLGLSEEAADTQPVETEAEPYLGSLDDNVDYTLPQQVETPSQTDIADHVLRGTETRSETEIGDHALRGVETHPLEDHEFPEDEPVRQESDEKDEDKPGSVVDLFGDSWSDPCIEFAFKTLSGVIPVNDDHVADEADTFQQQADTSHAAPPPPGGCLALLDFGAPNPFQNNNLSDSETLGKPAFLPPGNASLPSHSNDGPRDQYNLEGNKEDQQKRNP